MFREKNTPENSKDAIFFRIGYNTHLHISTTEHKKGLFLDYTSCLSLVGRDQPPLCTLQVTASEIT